MKPVANRACYDADKDKDTNKKDKENSENLINSDDEQ